MEEVVGLEAEVEVEVGAGLVDEEDEEEEREEGETLGLEFAFESVPRAFEPDSVFGGVATV